MILRHLVTGAVKQRLCLAHLPEPERVHQDGAVRLESGGLDSRRVERYSSHRSTAKRAPSRQPDSAARPNPGLICKGRIDAFAFPKGSETCIRSVFTDRAVLCRSTSAIIGALEAEIARERAAKPLAERLLAIAADLKSKAGPNGRRMTRGEIDALWGQ